MLISHETQLRSAVWCITSTMFCQPACILKHAGVEYASLADADTHYPSLLTHTHTHTTPLLTHTHTHTTPLLTHTHTHTHEGR